MRRSGWLWIAALCLGFAGRAAADTVARTERAVAACRSGDAAQACEALRDAESALAAELGAAHPWSAQAAARRARVCGEPEPKPPGRGKPSRPSPRLAKAFRGLSACTDLKPGAPAGEAASDAFPQLLGEARAHYAAGRLGQALMKAEAAAELARIQLDPRRIAESQELVAMTKLAQGRWGGAVRAAQDAAGSAIQSGDVDVRIRMARLVVQVGDAAFAEELLAGIPTRGLSAVDAAELAEARGVVALSVGRAERAAGELDRAVALQRKARGARSESVASALQWLGDAQRESGNYPAASASYDAALALRREARGERDPEVAETLNAIGVLRADFDDWSAADAAFAEAFGILVAERGAEHPQTLRVALNRGRARWGADPGPASLEAYAKVVAKLAQVQSDEHAGVAAAIRNLARMNADLGRYAEADALYERALAAQARSLGAAHPDASLTRVERARLLARRGELERAESEIRSATEALAEVMGAGHPLVAQYRTELARVSLARGDGSAARREALLAARQLALHLQRSFGAMSDRQRRQLADRSQAVTSVLLSLPGDDMSEIYQALLPHRDSVVRSIAESQAAARARDAEGAALLDELARKRELYVASLLGAASAERAQTLAREIDALEARAASRGAAPRARDPAKVVRAACGQLPADAAVIEFIEYDRVGKGSIETTPAYLAFVVRGSGCGVRAVRLGAAAPITDAARRFGEAMRASQQDVPKVRAELSRLLASPVQPALAGAERWLVVPDGGLWGVPIGVLPDPKAPGHYLLERVVVGYLTSIYELAQKRGGGSPLDRALVVGAPDFGPASGGGPVVLTGAGPCRMTPFDPLPGTLAEAEAIAGILESAELLLGADASKTRLRSELARKPTLIHLATHGYFAGLEGGCASGRSAGGQAGGVEAALDPLLLSGVVFAGANNGLGKDGANGILTASEVTKLDLRSARLVVLSACDSGTGSRQRGQELQGLRWAFRAAGAGSMVTSLWRSNDAVTRAMMQSFYEGLRAPDLPDDAFRGAEALRRAKLVRIQKDSRLGMKRPLTWANFVFSGVL